MELSIVVPVFNEVESLGDLQQRLHDTLSSLGSTYEIIYVDDASTDLSLDKLKEMQGRFKEIRIISLRCNRGQSTALWAGFRVARGKWIITLDADLQNPPEEITKLIAYKDRADFITGLRAKRRDAKIKKVSSRIAFFFRRMILRDPTVDTGCALKMFKAEVLNDFPPFRNFHRFFSFLVRQSGFSTQEVTLEHHQRKFGVSKYGTLKRAWEGVVDLLGVAWLKKRIINYEIKYKS